MTLKLDTGFENILNSTMKEFTMPVPVLHRVPTEYDICTEWDAVDELEPISSHIGQLHLDGSQYSDRLEHRCSNDNYNTSH